MAQVTLVAGDLVELYAGWGTPGIWRIVDFESRPLGLTKVTLILAHPAHALGPAEEQWCYLHQLREPRNEMLTLALAASE